MCMLSFYPDGVMPTERHILNGAELNPDGHGFAIVTRDRNIIVHRGMDADEIVERFLEARDKHPEGPALFHSRIATSGLVDVTGCHPFKVGQDNRTVVAHNGILFSPPADSLKSDTAIFAERMLPRFGSLDKQRNFTKLQRFAGWRNKLVVLTVNPQRRRTSYVINKAAGHTLANGEWHSNTDYEGKWWDDFDGGSVYVSGSYSKYQQSDNSPWACDLCGQSGGVNRYTLLCDICNCCNDCLQHRDDCQCFMPASLGAKATIAIGAGESGS